MIVWFKSMIESALQQLRAAAVGKVDRQAFADRAAATAAVIHQQLGEEG